MLSSTEIRQQYIDFFVKKCGHAFVPSSPVVPHDDPTLLFTNAGMNQFKPYFLGTEKPKFTRVVNTQKCIRAGGKHNDLDDVGRDTYHHTFFEMLGNWSFGDYFKKDAITWAWQLLTEVWKLDPARLHVTVFEGNDDNGIPRDDEAADLWKSVGVLDGHVHLGNAKDNFWEMGETGPCGPCTEVHFDRTPDKTGGKLVNGGSADVIEIWNNVFIQFNRNEDRSLTPLPAKHVDTGMGFERICAVINGLDSNYDTDVFTPIFDAIREVTGARPYGGKLDDAIDTAYRVIGDHIRTLTFALTDGAVPDKVGRGSVLRSVLRRASLFGWLALGQHTPFLHALVPTVVAHLVDAFPELRRNPERVRGIILDEENGFLRTVERGLKLFAEAKARAATNGNTINAKDAFDLHTEQGFFIDITQKLAADQGFTVDVAGYDALFAEFQKVSRGTKKALVVTAIQGVLPRTDDAAKYAGEPITAKLVGWVRDNVVVTAGEVGPGESVAMLLDRTPFYGEQGGQVGDTGRVTGLAGEFTVEATQRLGETTLHSGTVEQGRFAVGDAVTLTPTATRRADVVRNHTATHLLNLALRRTLGDHVEQKGSLVDDEKTRFDFAHDKPLTPDEVRAIEEAVNRAIQLDLPVTAVTMPLDEAKKIASVRAVFGEKYPDPVRVVTVGESAEFCGGVHVPRSGTIGLFKIVSQDAVAKGVRRITAVTGRAAVLQVNAMAAVLDGLTGRLQCKPEELAVRVETLQDELKKAQAGLKKLQAANLAGLIDELLATAPVMSGTTVVVGQLAGGSVESVRQQVDRIRQKCQSAFVVLAWEEDGGKVPVVVALTNDMTAKGLKAGDLIKPIAAALGGSGGGKPDMAQAAGKDAAQIPAALEVARKLAAENLA
jgi:alanyl-tRNA synthetase